MDPRAGGHVPSGDHQDQEGSAMDAERFARLARTMRGGMAKERPTSTTRRTVVRTGAKLAYAAPLVAASFTLSAGAAAAQAVSPPADVFCLYRVTAAPTGIPPNTACPITGLKKGSTICGPCFEPQRQCPEHTGCAVGRTAAANECNVLVARVQARCAACPTGGFSNLTIVCQG
jgi:hypothetical protein